MSSLPPPIPLPPPIRGLEPPEPDGDRLPTAVAALSLEAARSLATRSPGFSRTPQLVLARQLAMLVESACELSEDSSASAPRYLENVASAWIALGVRPADLVQAMLEAEALLDRVVLENVDEGGAAPERWAAALREGLREALRCLNERLTPLDAEREHRRLTGLLEVLPEAILLVDHDERVSFANGAVRDAYGLEPSTVIGRSLADVLTEPAVLLRLENPEDFLAATLRLLDASEQPYEDVFRQLDGSAFVRRSLPAGADGRVVLTTNVTRVRLRNQEIDRREAWARDLAAGDPARARRTATGLQLLQGGLSD